MNEVELNFNDKFFVFYLKGCQFLLISKVLTSQNGLIFDCMMNGNLHSSHEFVSLAVSHC